ncbi:NlpC/P60 family protein, partial [Streptomyces spororaveus]
MPSKSGVARATGTLVALSLATAVLASAPVNAAQVDAPSAAAVAAVAATADVERPQGKPEPLKTEGAGKSTFSGAAAAQSAAAPITRSAVIARAKTWVDAKVPYSMNNYRDGYRTDCSGLVSMAWNLGTSAWTGNLDTFADRISKNDLRKGDMLLFHNPSNPERGSHVTIFEQWTDASHTSYIGIEQTPPNAVRRVIPYAYFNNASSYIPYRYKNIIEDATPTNAGVYRSDEAKFYVADRSGGLYGWSGFGVPGDKPLTGDWNAD